MRANTHPQQADRLAALYSYDILDTDRESDFDHIVALASRICGTQMSVINLIDADRQWFKAETGFGVRETPLETSICSHVILEHDFTEIPDLLIDPRTMDNPLCGAGAGLRFYAGALLKSSNGLPIGTLCVLDKTPRHLNELQKDSLRLLARQVMKQLELRLALQQAHAFQKEIDHMVKNSLQMITSITRIEARKATTDELRSSLERVMQRIESVAVLHQELYETDAGEKIDLLSYTTKIAGLIGAGLPAHVAIVVKMDAIRLDSKRAATIGIIVNEFATNSAKHAFPDNRSGTISISCTINRDGIITFACMDDGIGSPGSTEAGAMPGNGTMPTKGIGMSIIAASCRQLDADWQLGAKEQGYQLTAKFRA